MAHVTYTQDPADYTEIGAFYRGTSRALHEAYAPDHRELARYFDATNLGGTDHWANLVDYNTTNGFGCWLCGAHFAHGVVFKHEPTGAHVAIGHTCGDYVGMSDKAAATKRRNTAAAAKAKAEAERAEAAAARWADTLADDPALAAAVTVDHDIIADIAAKGAKWGSISDKQRAFVLRLADEASGPAAEPEIRVPVPTGLTTVTGEVVSIKWKDSYYGGAWKMTVKVTTPAGVFVLWGTLPSAIGDAKVGDTVRFNVSSITRSDRDESFGFFKRPSSPAIVARVNPPTPDDAIVESNALANTLEGTYVYHPNHGTGMVIWTAETADGGRVGIRWDDMTTDDETTWHTAEWAFDHKIIAPNPEYDLERYHGRFETADTVGISAV